MITSASNPRIKLLRKLQQRKYREEYDRYYLEGPRHVLEALASGAGIDYVVVCPELVSDPNETLTLLNSKLHSDQILTVSRDTFTSFSLKDGPKGLAAVLSRANHSIQDVNPPDWGCVALSSIANPGNLGTILRTCDAVGISLLILLDRSTDPYDPTALRAGMGAHFSVTIARADFVGLLAWRKQHGFALIGTSDSTQSDYHEVHYPDRFILLMGSEREGLSHDQVSQCDLMVRIPMRGKLDSLNLAVATSVLLYEMYNQKRDQYD